MPLPRVRTLDLSPIGGEFVALGHGQVPPRLPKGFSRPRFSEADQLAHPDQPMTRVVKDVLRVGKWKIGRDAAGKFQFWNVQRGDLIELCNAHRDATCRGVAMNLTKSHGDLATGIVPTDELICPVDEMVVDGDVLWVSCYVTPEQAKYLRNPACKVSPGIWDDWSDGYGNVYPSKMLHVAVTDHPVIPGQGPFVAMANSQSNSKGRTMDFAALVEAINALLAVIPPGWSLPEDTSEETINRDLAVITAALGGGSADAPADTPADPSMDMANAGGIGMNNPASQQSANAGQRSSSSEPPTWFTAFAAQVAGQFKTLNNNFATLQAGKALSSQQAFVNRVTELGRAGVPARETTRLMNLGRQYNWDQSLLPASADDVPGRINMSNPAKRLANPDAPGVKPNANADRPTDEDCKKTAAKFFGTIPAKKS